MPDKTFTAAASLLTPGTYDDQNFMRLMVHTCDIEFASRGTATSGSYGHKKIDFDSPTQVYTGVRCRLRALTADEIQATGRVGEVVEDMVLYVPRRWLPESMKEHAAAVLHQVVNVKTLRGEMVNAGPLDVQSIREVASMQHHYEVTVRKAG
jgi:hypothetical protein